MRLRNICLVGVELAILITTAAAQTPGAIQRVDDSQQQRKLFQSAQSLQAGDSAPELYPEENGDLGPQTVLKAKPRHTLFEAMADVQYFYTDNMFLTEKDPVATDVLLSTVQFALAPAAYDLAGGKLAPRIGYRHQWFDFGLLGDEKVQVFNFQTGEQTTSPVNIFDFNSQTAFADAQWSKGNWVAEVGFDFQRLLSTANYEEFYREYVPRWSLERVIPLCERSALIVGYAGDFRFGEPKPFIFVPPSSSVIRLNPDLGNRTDQSLFATFNQILCPHVALQPYYQLRYTHFTESTIGRRNDLLSSVGAAVYWTVCPNCEIRTFVDYNLRFSDNADVSEYRQFDGGGGIDLSIRF